MPRKYTPNEKEKYMCEKHRTYFKKKLVEWKNEIIELNKSLYENEYFESDDNKKDLINNLIKYIQIVN